MEMKDLNEGMRLPAVVKSYGVRENLRLDGALEAHAEIEIHHFNGETIKTQWNGLLMTRDGGRNSRTFKCLESMKCFDNVVDWLNRDLKDIKVEVVIGLRPNKRHPLEPYKVIDWINKPAGTRPSGDVISRLKEAGLGAVGDQLTPQPKVDMTRHRGKPKDDPDGLPF